MYTLYYAPDNASLVVRIVLEEIGAGYNTWLVDRTANEHKTLEYRELNPNGLVPVCIVDGRPVFETAAILLTIAERHGALAPSVTSKDRPQFLKWLFFLSNTLHSDLRLWFYPGQYVGPDKANIDAHAAVTRKRLGEHFKILEKLYGDVSTPYLWGDEPTIVDIYAAMCLRWPQIYPPDEPPAFNPGDYPALDLLLRTLEKRSAVRHSFEAEGISAPYLSGAKPPEPSADSAR
ncbi:MAG: glutathione S-transferase family protein [Pseudomonadota bacterium]